MALDLVQLKEMQVRNCVMMEQIIINDGAEEATTNTIMFTSLEYIFLESCSNLRSFYLGSNSVECPSLIRLTVQDCPKMVAFATSSPRQQKPFFSDKVDCEGIECPVLSDSSKAIEIRRDNFQKSLDVKNLKFLDVYGCNSLKNIFTTSMALNLVQLERMRVRNCVMMEQIITNDGAEEATTNTIMFPSLESLILKSCSSLRSFYWGHGTVEYPCLTNLAVKDCPKMVAFATSSPRKQNIKTIGIAPFFSDKVSFCLCILIFT
ncbi:uncharacterized protein LOC111277908 [Durio zibethinus]|uniref:Uncharacterized protein LOC111277908 n=1 Tax=Durio zibethinus TaxID=66656 RepID=A0A6P5WWS6_DURZI|nr:uncharacterized protein LOC111277908 [Durio zibethinus]